MKTNESHYELHENRNKFMGKAADAYANGNWETALRYLKEAKKYDSGDSHITTNWLIAESYEHLNNLFMADIYYRKADRGTNHPYKFQKEFYSRHKSYRPITRLFVTLIIKYNDYCYEKCKKEFCKIKQTNQ